MKSYVLNQQVLSRKAKNYLFILLSPQKTVFTTGLPKNCTNYSNSNKSNFKYNGAETLIVGNIKINLAQWPTVPFSSLDEQLTLNALGEPNCQQNFVTITGMALEVFPLQPIINVTIDKQHKSLFP